MSFCAQCIEESPDLVLVYLTDRPVLLCPTCRDEHPRSGRWSFAPSDRSAIYHPPARRSIPQHEETAMRRLFRRLICLLLGHRDQFCSSHHCMRCARCDSHSGAP